MRSLKSYFTPPTFAGASTGLTPGKKHTQEIEDPVEASSSPLSDPPPSSNVSRPTPIPDTPNGPDAQLNTSLSQSLLDHPLGPSAREESFQGTEPTAPPSTLNASFASSQRIVKGGKEVVISSDGEDTDSLGDFGDLEDPSTLFAPTPKPGSKNDPVTKPARLNEASLAKLTAQKKYKNSIDDLVYDALDDNEIEDKVAKVKAGFARYDGERAASKYARDSTIVNEDMLASALGDNYEEEGPGLHRLLHAVRRTEALDQDRVWRFFDQVSMTPAGLEFPKDIFPSGSNWTALQGQLNRLLAIVFLTNLYRA